MKHMTLNLQSKLNLQGKADLHMHSNYSDGVASVSQVLAHVAKHTDLDVIAITDHDCMTGSLQAAQQAKQFGIEAIAGEEISSQQGHILALFTEQHISAGQSADATIRAIHAQGGLAIAPHPFDASVPSLGCSKLGKHLHELGLDAIESFNSGVYWHERACNAIAGQFAKNLRLPQVGGSDAHSLRTVGKGFTQFVGRTANDVYKAIKTNQVLAGGTYWTIGDYADNWLHAIQQQGVFEFARWVWRNTGYRVA